jgi:acyl carrier protein
MTQESADAFEADPRVGQILDIFAKETGTERAALRPEASIEALGIASLDLTLAVFQIESTFDVEIPVVSERPGNEFETVGDLVAHVIAVLDRKVRAAPSAPGAAA